MNVRIPDTPGRLLALIDFFTVLRDDCAVRGEPWPASLDEWAEVLERSADVERA